MYATWSLRRLVSPQYNVRLFTLLFFICFTMVIFSPGNYMSALKYSSSKKIRKSLHLNTTSDYDDITTVLHNSTLLMDVEDNLSEPEVNPHNFRYIINPYTMCNQKQLRFFIYVHSAPVNHKKRLSIRETWGAREILEQYGMRLVFVMGVVSDTLIMDNVQLESDLYGDIIVEDFHDSYRNMTLKAVAALKWVATFCRTPKYIIKTDDDVFVDIHPFMKYLNSDSIQNSTEHLVMCYLWENTKVARDKTNKWYVSKEEHRDNMYPSYCSGSIFVISFNLVDIFHGLSYTTPYFWIDDVFLTGILTEKSDVHFIKLNKHYVLDEKGAMKRFRKDKKHTLKFFHVDNIDELYYMWARRSSHGDKDFVFEES